MSSCSKKKLCIFHLLDKLFSYAKSTPCLQKPCMKASETKANQKEEKAHVAFQQKFEFDTDKERNTGLCCHSFQYKQSIQNQPLKFTEIDLFITISTTPPIKPETEHDDTLIHSSYPDTQKKVH